MPSNRYGWICYKCGNWCEPGQGVYEKVTKVQRAKWPMMPVGNRWQVQHHECVRGYPKDAHYKYNPIARPNAKYQLRRAPDANNPIPAK